MQPFYTSNARLLLSLKAMKANIASYRTALGTGTQVLLMVKANGYGTNSVEVARQMAPWVDYLGTAYTPNGLALRKDGISTPILVMAAQPEHLPVLLAHQLEPVLYSLEMIKAAIALNQPLKAHIELDTGMKRLGLPMEQVAEAGRLLADSRVKTVSVFSHLVAPSEPQHDAFTHQQATLFNEGYQVLTQPLATKPLKHLASSGAALRFPEYHLDMVRLGIGFYGYNPTNAPANIEPMAKLKTTILQLTHVPKGQTIGYSRHGKLPYDATIATLSIGYGDGYLRVFGNGNARVYINGSFAHTVGNICMDLTMVDVTHINCKVGDEVELFGPHITIAELSKKAHTIPYEILTNISSRVERVLVEHF